MEEKTTKKTSAFDVFSPTQVFFGGAVLGLLVICTLGFFVLLSGAFGSVGGGATDVKGVAANVGAGQGSGDVVAPTPTNITVKEVGKDDHITGAKKAKVTLIEYSDFECPFCGRFVPTVQSVLDNYGDSVRVVYRHFPLSFHPQARPAANASECASEQGKFWEFHDDLFERQDSLSSATFSAIAKDIGLNISKFESCVSAKKYDQKVSDDIASGTAAGVNGTPHTILISEDGRTIPLSGALPFEQVRASIDSLLN
jgi:protein-disulfide isomerase